MFSFAGWLCCFCIFCSLSSIQQEELHPVTHLRVTADLEPATHYWFRMIMRDMSLTNYGSSLFVGVYACVQPVVRACNFLSHLRLVGVWGSDLCSVLVTVCFPSLNFLLLCCRVCWSWQVAEKPLDCHTHQRKNHKGGETNSTGIMVMCSLEIYHCN